MESNLEFYKKIILRTPLLPKVQNITKEEIKNWIIKKEIQEAIFVASPSLHTELIKYLNGEVSKKESEEKLFHSLSNYLLRMMNRCTPFGLFSGCTTVEWGEEENLKLFSLDKIDRHTRLDMFYLCNLTQELEKMPELRNHLIYFSNSSINQKKNLFTYVEYTFQKNDRIHTLTAVEIDEFLKLLLKQLENGCSLDSMVKIIIDYDNEIEEEEAKNFLFELIDSQILVSELEPNVTGKEYLEQILNVLERISNLDPSIENIFSLLKSVESDILALDQSMWNEVNPYKNISSKLTSVGINFELSKLFQVDLNKLSEEKLSLPFSIQDQLLECIEFLNRVYIHSGNNNLKKFTAKFLERYDYEAIPLLDVLDTERGLGYPVQDSEVPNPLLENLFISESKNISNELERITFNSFTKILFSILMDRDNDSFEALDLSKRKEFQDMNSDSGPTFPSSFSCMFSLTNQDFKNIYLKAIGGTSSINLIARFSHSNPEIKTIVTAIAKFEEEELINNSLLAEIAHLPDNRVGNILLRPSFRKHEIPYLAKSNINYENQIHLSDILVKINQDSGAIDLISKKKDKIILPRLSIAHNFSTSTHPIYRFLCELQTQNIRAFIGFKWGSLIKLFKFLPRVTYKNIILSRAVWYLKKADFEEIIMTNSSKLKEWKLKWKLPDLVVLCDFDRELLVNFTSPFLVQGFLKLIKNRSNITLREYIFDSDTSVMDQNGNSYANEFMSILLSKKKKEKTYDNKNDRKRQVEPTSKFHMGSEWLYFKIYCGIEFSDDLLLNFIQPIIAKYLQSEIIDKYFFIRYYDPDFHIRLRFHFKNKNKIGDLMIEFHNKIEEALSDGLIHKIQVDSYIRELKRYGVNTIEYCENIFYCDSSSVIEAIGTINEIEDEKFRWLFAVLSLDNYLSEFSFSLNEKKNFVSQLKDSFSKEFNIQNKPQRKSLNDHYRSHKEEIQLLFDQKHSYQNSINKILSNRSFKWGESISKIKNSCNDKSGHDINSLIASLIHMNMNRLFRSEQRYHEFIIYNMLDKHYQSQLARIKYQGS